MCTVAALGLLLAGCAAMPPDFREINSRNLHRVQPGMSRQDVFAIMGTDTRVVRESIYTDMQLKGYLDLTVSNPYRSETFQRGDDDFEVLYYYAMPGGMDMTYWDTQYDARTVPTFFLTPVVLRNGSVAGVGMKTMVEEGLSEPPTGLDQEASMLTGS